MQCRLIINADDFGWDSDATQAILTLAESHKITSTTVMAGMAETNDLKQLKNFPYISTGIHLNLISGYPLSSRNEVSSLVNSDGQFFDAAMLLKRFMMGKIKLAQLELEIINQLNFIKQHHLKISHADSHKHVHQFPILGPIIIHILRQQGILKIRNCNVLNYNTKKMFIVKSFNSFSRLLVSGYLSPEVLITSFSNAKDASIEIFKKAVNKAFLKHHTVEFMTHPGLKNREGSYLNRLSEYMFWMNENWSQVLKSENILLKNYNNL